MPKAPSQHPWPPTSADASTDKVSTCQTPAVPHTYNRSAFPLLDLPITSKTRNTNMPIGESNRFNRPEGSGARNTQEKIRLIVNPRAGGGRAGLQLDALRQKADRAFEQWELVTTEAPGHASHLASEGAELGFDLVAAVGGDGTCHAGGAD